MQWHVRTLPVSALWICVQSAYLSLSVCLSVCLHVCLSTTKLDSSRLLLLATFRCLTARPTLGNALSDDASTWILIRRRWHAYQTSTTYLRVKSWLSAVGTNIIYSSRDLWPRVINVIHVIRCQWSLVHVSECLRQVRPVARLLRAWC